MAYDSSMKRTRWVGLLALGVAAPLFAGCSAFAKAPEPDSAVADLAKGLSSGDLGSVALQNTGSGEAPAFVKKAYAGMGTMRPTVDVVSVTKGNDDTKATAKLHTVWDVSTAAKDWTYDSDVTLSLVDRTWRVNWTPALVAPELTDTESLVLIKKWPRRADILDRKGAALVTQREVFLVGLDKTKLTAAQVPASAAALAKLVGIDATAYAASAVKAGAQAFVQAIVLRGTDPIIMTRTAAITAIPGAAALSRLVPLGPTKTFAQPILGSVGEASAEVVAKSGGVLETGDEVGLGGLEAQYDTRLRGTAGLAIQAVSRDAGGNFLGRREVFAQSPTGVAALKTTLDTAAQAAAEAALASQTAMPAALVAIKASTGEVIAAANSPGAKGLGLAMTAAQAPGSTFKVISALAVLRKGATPSSPLPCTSTITVNGRVFTNYSEFPASHLGIIPLYTALAFSCNTAFISQYQKVTQDDLTRAANALGLGQQPTLGFANFMGSVPAAGTVVEHAATFIGQGKVTMSPLALATMVSSVIKGAKVSPVLVPEAKQTNPPAAVPLTAAEAAGLREAMGHVVSDGSGHRLQAVGVQYAKTGTAEYGTAVPPKTHAWMVAGRGDLAIACYVQDGASGTTSAGPLISDFLTRIGSAF